MVYALPIAEADLRAGTVPVGKSRRGRDLLLLQEGKAFTHLAYGTFTGMRVALKDIYTLSRPIQFLELPALIPKRLVAHALRVFAAGGTIPPKTGEAIRNALVHLMPELREYIDRA